MAEKPYTIRCDVDSCIYNEDAKHCHAEKINICSTCAEPECCDETVCKTFKSRTEA